MTKMRVLETGDVAEYRMGLIDPNDLQTSAGSPLPVTEVRVRRFGTQFLNIGAVGYGEKAAENGHGFPVMLEVHQGRLRLLVWGDINLEDPTHSISLEGARESLRRDEP